MQPNRIIKSNISCEMQHHNTLGQLSLLNFLFVSKNVSAKFGEEVLVASCLAKVVVQFLEKTKVSVSAQKLPKK
jgi:hypothetical protein